MKKRCGVAALQAALIGMWCGAIPALAQGTEVHAFISNGVKGVIDELRPQAEKAIGHPLAIQFGTTTALKQRIEAGESFDVTILTTEAVTELVKSGKADSRVDLARSGIGMGMRAGAVKPDIRTAEALKQALHRAKAVSFARDGASRVHLEEMFQGFGMAEEMKGKTMLESGSAASNNLVRDGKAEYVLTLVSEILPAAPGVVLVGALPEEVQSYVSFAGAASAKTANGEAARGLLRFLKSAAAQPVYRAKGMEAR